MGKETGSQTYEKLKDFLMSRMRMSHVYQPLMLKVLIEGNGSATIRQIASAFLAHDEAQLEYYEQITKRMPGRVLQSHGLVERGDVPCIVGLGGTSVTG